MRTNNKIWACEENYLLNYLDTRLRAESMDAEKIKALSLQLPGDVPESILQKNGSVATITIKGILSNTGPDIFDRLFGIDVTSFPAIIDAVNNARNDNGIKETFIKFDTPGGEVIGGDEAAQAIAALAKSKNTIGVNEGTIASMGFWLASQTGNIFSTSPSNVTGSIGVIITAITEDFDAETPGIKKARIVSRNAPDKVPDLATDEGRNVLQKEADAIERVFIARVASGRGVSEDTVKKDFGRGGVLIAQDPDETKPDAINTGMIDGLINITSSPNSVTRVMETTATIEQFKNPQDMEDNRMSENTPKILTVAELRKQQPAAVETIEKEAKTTEGNRIKSIEGLMDQVASLPETAKAKVRKEIDARKFEEGSTAEKISVELLGIISKAQVEFVNQEANTGRAAADVAAHASKASAPDASLTEEEETTKRRADALEQAAKDLQDKEAN